MKFFNTLTRQKEEFNPLNGNEVRLYSCGPTVYSFAHIGNMRAYLFVDTLRRALKYNGYTLIHAMNITDVGHLESDADEGEDKMEKAARKEGKDPYEVARFYTAKFLEDCGKLNIDLPGIICKATEHIPEMIEYVKGIISNGYGYETSTSIYFDVSKLPKYGVLSNQNIDEQIAGARVDLDVEKRNSYDFVIMIKAPKEHIMKWETPWGLCYPGWHIECSAMSRKYLGDEFDIHTGGVDHIPIHHENEIAQCYGYTGKMPAKTWMHNEFLLIDNGKMSKSLNNVYTLDILQEKGIEPLAYKMFCFTSHYRNKLNFTWDGAKAAQVSLNRLREATLAHNLGSNVVDSKEIEGYKNQFLDCVNDDLNMTAAMAIVWEVAKKAEKSKDYYKLLCDFDKVLGLGLDEISKQEVNIPDEVQSLLSERRLAREEKDFKKSDELRDKILELGFSVKDTKDGVVVEKI